MGGRLEITTHIGCPMNCDDCPQALLRSKYQGRKTMDFEDYKKAIDKVPKFVRIDFSGMCEPFVNKHCADMILYAAEKGHPLALYTTLQGATMEDYERLKDVKYEVVTIHIPDKEGRSTFVITNEYLELLSKWECNNYSCHGTISEEVLPYIKQGKNLITFMHDRAGNVEGRPHLEVPIDRRITCMTAGLSLNHNVLLPDGTVLMCCMDYGMTEVFGNLFKDEYFDIVKSYEAVKMREKMTGGECLCRHCANARLI